MKKLQKLNDDLLWSIILIVAGACFIFFPSSALALALRITGAIICAFRIYKICVLLARYERTRAIVFLILNDVLLLICGLMLLVNPTGAIRIVCLVIGVWLIISSGTNLFLLSQLKKSRRIWCKITLYIIEILIGFILVLYPSPLAKLIGAILGIGLLMRGITQLLDKKTKLRPKRKSNQSSGKEDYITTDFTDKTNE